MKNTSNNIYLYPVCIICALILQSCTGLHTYPVVARAGDTISIAVGSADGMRKDPSNTTVVYRSDSGGLYPLDIRSVFNLYPDKKSRLYTRGSPTLPVIDSSKHEAWQTVMVIDLPHALPAGNGVIEIDTIAKYPLIYSHINDVNISLEIIDGIGDPNVFEYEYGVGSSVKGDLSLLEPLPYAQVVPPVDNQYYGAIQLKLSLPTDASIALTDEHINVVIDDMTPSTQSNRNLIWSVKDSELLVMILSPKGWLQTIEARFSVVLIPRFNFVSTPEINSIEYYDNDGNLLPGPPASDYMISIN